MKHGNYVGSKLPSFQFGFSPMEEKMHWKESNIISPAGNSKLSSYFVADCIPGNRNHLTLDE
jgi:hypothetical protein